MFTIGLFAIIFDDEGKVLLQERKDYNLWDLPGGGMEEGETPWEGLKREVMEETGLDVEVGALVGLYSNTLRNELVLPFVCEVKGGILKETEEASNHTYHSVEKLPPNLNPRYLEWIKDARNNDSKPVHKSQSTPVPDSFISKWVQPRQAP